jgi:hypothetical protein
MNREEAERIATVIEREHWITSASVIQCCPEDIYAIFCDTTLRDTFLFVKSIYDWIKIKQTVCSGSM